MSFDIVRNLNKVKGALFCPILFCLKIGEPKSKVAKTKIIKNRETKNQAKQRKHNIESTDHFGCKRSLLFSKQRRSPSSTDRGGVQPSKSQVLLIST